MITTINNKNFVGPKALFDPLYVPPVILYRKKEENSLFSILKDCLYDNYSMNILYQGIEGIGKKVIINKVLRDLIKQNEDLKNYKEINIDCKEKSLEELVISILSILLRVLNINIDISIIINLKISQLWSILKLAIKKLKNKFIIVLNNSECMESNVLKKLLSFGKESKITIISTINKVLQPNSWEILSQYDFKRKLNYFTYNQLFSILKQRTSLCFSHEIDIELIEFITDIIFDNYIPIPGKGIEILKDLYPNLQKGASVNYNLMIEISQNHFDSFLIFDEFNMLSFLSEEDLLTMIFLDNLTNYFINKSSNFYISLKSLEELFFISCEAIEYSKKIEEFNQMITKLKNLGIIYSSKKPPSIKMKHNMEKPLLSESFFILISPLKLKAMIDAIFEKNNVIPTVR